MGGGKCRILYGVHGYGRGHASRALAVLPELTRRHDILILAGDEAYHQLRVDFPVVRIPTLRYYQGKRHRRSARLTIRRNLPAVADLLMGGPAYRMVLDEMRRFAPDVVISDSEAWTHRAARTLRIGRISFDHYGIMVHCRPDMALGERLIGWAESLAYRMLVCKPERVIVTAFYDGPPRREGVRVVGPILREQVLRTQPVRGEHLLAYFSNAAAHFTPGIERAMAGLDCPVKIYGPQREAAQGNLEFCPIANEPFIRDLAGCRAVFSTAGNQLISEAIHFGKPLLVMPEAALEQKLNARFVRRWRIGMRTMPRAVTADLLRQFLGRSDEFAGNIPPRRRDGLAEAVEALEEAIEDLASQRPPAPD